MVVSLRVADPNKEDLAAVADTIFRLGASHDRFTAQMRRRFDLNAHERLAISALWSEGPMTMTQLGQWIPLSRAAVTTLVDRLEGAGIVSRGSDENDRRRTVVSLAPYAIEGMRPVVEPWGADLARVVAERSEEEWQVITRFVEDLRAVNDRHAKRLSAMEDAHIQSLGRADATSKGTP